MTDLTPDQALAAAVKAAHRAVWLAFIAALVAVVVLAIDNGIKRDILAATAKVRRDINDFDLRVLSYGLSRPGPDSADSGAAPVAADHVGDAPGASAETDHHAANSRYAASERDRGAGGGAPGDG